MKKIVLFYLGILIVTQLIGCAAPARQFKHPDDTAIKLQLQRFEDARGLSASEIPEQYDVSRLRQGSQVKMKLAFDYFKWSGLMTKVLREIRSTGGSKVYLIDLVRDKNTFTSQEDALSLARVIQPQKGPSFPKIAGQGYQGVNFPTTLIQGALAAGVIGVAINLSQYSNMKEAAKQRAKQLEDAIVESKILSFDLISNERIDIAGKEVLCKVYQVHAMTIQIMPSSESLPGMKAVTDESKKVWISDEVPFGFVKSQSTQTACTYLEPNGRFPGQAVTQKPQGSICEVVEFSY